MAASWAVIASAAVIPEGPPVASCAALERIEPEAHRVTPSPMRTRAAPVSLWPTLMPDFRLGKRRRPQVSARFARCNHRIFDALTWKRRSGQRVQAHNSAVYRFRLSVALSPQLRDEFDSSTLGVPLSLGARVSRKIRPLKT